MLSLVIVLLGCVGIAMSGPPAPCSVAQKTLNDTATSLKTTVANLPGNMMAGNCLLSVVYNDILGNVSFSINGTLVFNKTFPGPPPNPGPAGSLGPAPAPPSGMMIWIVNPVNCSAYSWNNNITDPAVAANYLNYVREGAILLGASHADPTSALGPALLMNPKMAGKKVPNLKNPQTGTPPVLCNAFLLQKGSPEKTTVVQITAGSSLTSSIRIQGNLLNMQLPSQ